MGVDESGIVWVVAQLIWNVDWSECERVGVCDADGDIVCIGVVSVWVNGCWDDFEIGVCAGIWAWDVMSSKRGIGVWDGVCERVWG